MSHYHIDYVNLCVNAQTNSLFFLRKSKLNFFLQKDDGPALVSRLLDQLMKSDKYGERRGAAFGLAGVVKGFGIPCLKKYNIVVVLRESLADRYFLDQNLKPRMQNGLLNLFFYEVFSANSCYKILFKKNMFQ